MFVCRACARRLTFPSLSSISNRRLGTQSVPYTASTIARRTVPRRSVATSTQAVVEQDAKAAEDGESPDAKGQDGRKLQRIARLHLARLKDPYTIAQHVQRTLDKGRFEEALQVTRMASKDYSVVVSWNHLMDYLLKKNNVNGAIKLFNEMKKRAQLPNAQTYTIIFRGCAESTHPTQAVYHATRLYYAMMDGGRIRPNSTHMNAVLQVCARARDLESLFTVLKTTNDFQRAPTAQTYTIILNALRERTERRRPKRTAAQRQDGEEDDTEDCDFTEEELRINEEKAAVSISRAKAVWSDVVAAWRAGRIVVDEELTCAMGRVLLTGGYHDNDAVLSLIEQTMRIPRQDSGGRDRNRDASANKTGSEAGAGAEDPDPFESRADSSSDKGDSLKAMVAGQPTRVPSSPMSNVRYARPGRNALSLVLTSLAATRKTSVARRYWDIFTVDYGVEPDSENWFRLLKALRLGHSSARAAEALLEMPQKFLVPRTFQIAMAACVRDALNDTHVFANAGKILDVMSRSLRAPDPMTLRLYLKVAMVANRAHRIRAREGGDPEGARRAMGQQLIRAFDRLWEPLRLASNALMYPDLSSSAPRREREREPERRQEDRDGKTPAPAAKDKDEGEGEGEAYNQQRELIALVRRLVGALDLVIGERMADEAVLKDLRLRRNVLNRQIGRFFDRREEHEPNLKRDEDEDQDWNQDQDEDEYAYGGRGKGGKRAARRRPAKEKTTPRPVDPKSFLPVTALPGV